MKSPDATTLLKKDHAKVKKLFESFEDAGDRALKLRQSLFDKIKEEITIHAMIEEEIFYPAFNAIRAKEAKKMVAEAHEEHALVKQLIAEIEELEPSDIKFAAKMKVLKDLVLHHAKEEEKEMFKEAKEEMSEEQLATLGAQMATRKEELAGQLPIEMQSTEENPAMEMSNGKTRQLHPSAN